MSTVREHLGLLWLLRRQLVATNPQYDQHWAMQASQFVGVHLDELIALAGGADIEDFAHKFFHEVPADFPANRPTATSAAGLSAPSVSADAKDGDQERWLEIGKAVERACGELPEGFDLHLELEKDAGIVRLYAPPMSDDDPGKCIDDFEGDTFAWEINKAIDAAIAAQSKEGGAA